MVCSIDDWKRRKLVKNEIRNNKNDRRGNRYISFIDRNDFDNYRLRRRSIFDKEPNFPFFKDC